MPLNTISHDGVFKRYSDNEAMHVGDTDSISHGFIKYAALSGTTLSTAAAQEIDQGVSFSAEAYNTSTGVWSAKVTANRVGMHKFELKGTFANGNIQILEFEIEVIDP